MTVINTNIKALYTQSALKQSERASHTAMEQLSTGKRINSSKDDAAGLAIAARMTQNIKGMNQSIRNAGDAISMIQTAEGATSEITTMLQRMSELAVQASNSTYSSDQRGYLNEEFQQLKSEIVRISEVHEWNGFPILNGKAGTPVGTPEIDTTIRAAVSGTTTGGKSLADGDLKILVGTAENTIPASVSADDTKSSTVAISSSKSASAISIAAAINSKLSVTGVAATANPAVIDGAKTTINSKSIQTDLYVNGEKISLSLTSTQTPTQRRQYVMDSINAKTSVHGVTAGDAGNGGIKLSTIDGRNLSVWYDSSVAVGSDFGLGLDTSTTSDPAGVTGVASAVVASAASVQAATVYGTVTLKSDKEFSLIPGANAYPTGATTSDGNKFTFPPVDGTNVISTDTVSFNYGGKNSSYSVGASETESATNFATQLNTVAGETIAYVGFTKTASASASSTTLTPTSMTGLVVGMSVSGTGITAGTYITAVNSTTVTLSAQTSAAITAGSITIAGGATSTKTASALVGTTPTILTPANITGLTVGMSVSGTGIGTDTYITAIGSNTVTLSKAVTADISSGTITFAPAKNNVQVITPTGSTPTLTITSPRTAVNPTVGTVTGSPTVSATRQVAAKDATYSNLSALGFTPGAVMAKNIGRLDFQVGPAASQLISIELADFGKNGDITGPITSDKAPTNILTVQAANDVIQNVNKSLDRIAETRANMGAVMNRLEHVIDNLTNVVMNSEASRSQIEDADYAKASTELARTQIMQQAATAVLAQANTSQQTVLKLLQD
jgi:flagellin